MGGPHRTINEFSLDKFVEQAKSDPVLAKYNFADEVLKVNGPRIGAPGHYYLRGNLSGVEDKPETFRWWVIEGGYSADEPELYASFRHFYDPRAGEIGRPAYLTDHIDELGNYLILAGLVTGDPLIASAGVVINPEVDARDWAINGTAHQGFGRNEYSWNGGVKYIQEAFSTTDAVEKDKLFAQGWRALGETMHLLADMTTPAHVRNDSHPALTIPLVGTGDPNKGFLKADPYEAFAQEGMVKIVGRGAIEPEMKQYIDQGSDALDLLDRVAMFTNTSFFSADTISGTDPRDGAVYHNANGMPDYPSPSLEQTTLQAGQFVKTIGNQVVCLAHESWVTEIGWGIAPKQITRRCVESQAAVLIPVAVAGNARLLDWFIPRVKVELTSADTDRRIVQGTVKHQPYGAYPTEMNFYTADGAYSKLWLNGSRQDSADYKVQVNNGVLRVTYGDTVARNIENARSVGEATLTVAIDLGAIDVRSNDLTLNKTTPTPTTAPTLTANSQEAAGAWVLKLVQPNVGKTEVQFRFEGLSCSGGTKVTSTETSATTATNGTCQIKGARDANSTTKHSWSRPPDRITPGQEWTGTLTASQSGLCYWSDVATEESCRKTTSTAHLVWKGDGWPGSQKEFEYDHLFFGSSGSETARAFDNPTGSFRWTVPEGSAGDGTLVLQFRSHTDGGEVFTNFWYEWKTAGN